MKLRINNMDEEKVIDALRKARVFINSVKGWKEEPLCSIYDLLEMFDGNEVEDIDRALMEFGIIC
jgi:hypothetical protein